jgi:hypothetical protein
MSRMRRVLPLFAALAALALPALAQAASPADVIRDCTLDGRLDKTYTQKELRQALSAIPSDVDEYTNCRDVIKAAQLAAATRGTDNASSGGGTTGGTTNGTGGTSGGATAGGTAGENGTGGASSGSSAGVFGGFDNVPADPTATATPAEKAALEQARDVVVEDDPVQEASVALPTPLIGALVIGGFTLLVFLALDLRRRLVDRRRA